MARITMEYKRLDHLLIAVFETIFDRQRESSMKEHYLLKWIAHQNYMFSEQMIRNDIALLQLEGRYQTYTTKEIMRLPTSELFDISGIARNNSNNSCNFLHWPLETFSWSTHPRYIYIRSARVQIIPRSTCRGMVTDIVISREQFCAALAEDEPALEGVSSGPLIGLLPKLY
ncbi:Trypsin [Popillia japonica]|uniref:Trypsin n=1 Tax=Popillia japonica TaxID=7064 RepID=A0AAW1ITZ9_POPJA